MTAARRELIPLDKQWRTLMRRRVNTHIRRRLEVQRSVCRPCLRRLLERVAALCVSSWTRQEKRPFLVLVRFIEAHSHNQKMLKMTAKEKVTCLENGRPPAPKPIQTNKASINEIDSRKGCKRWSSAIETILRQ